jgi:hypothetical protein
MRDQTLIDSELQKIADDLRQLWPSSDVPQQLYHYTDSRGLIGILESKKLWATDINYLNDSMELRYGSEIISKAIEEKLAEQTDELKTFLEDVRVYVMINSSSTNAYVVCFCEENNLLSQWRAYASRGAGYSIGIEARALVGVEYDGPGILVSETRLRRVLYDRATQQTLVRNTIDRFCSLFLSVLEGSRDETKSIILVANALARELWQHMYYFKSAAFSEEREWRLITIANVSVPWIEQTGLRFRASDTTIIPYIELRLDVPSSIMLQRNHAIWSVTLGPTLQPDLTERALYALLETTLGRGNGIYVNKSGISIRTNDSGS